MRDFNKKPIEGALYLNSQTGEPLRVVKMSKDDKLRYLLPIIVMLTSFHPSFLKIWLLDLLELKIQEL
jgi:hypothetical protein